MLADIPQTDLDVNLVFETTDQISSNKIIELYNFSRTLVATNTLDVLYDSTVRYVVNIVQVDFCRILTVTNDQQFVCQASYFLPEVDRKTEIADPPYAQRIYKRVINQNTALVINKSQRSLSQDEGKVLFLHNSDCLCLVPMLVSSDTIGLLILGSNQNGTQQSPQQTAVQPFHDGKVRLAKLIADQSASAIHRAWLSNTVQCNHLEMVMALARALEARDESTGRHSATLVKLAQETAEKMGCPMTEIQTIGLAARLHDIGKIGVPDEILHKPGPLNIDEWKIMKQHPDIGADIVLSVSKLSDVSSIIRSHHERYDGNGYPSGLRGKWISLGSRILAVVDAYEAIKNGRIYQAPRSHQEALAELRRCAGSYFDPEIVEAFCCLFSEE